MKFSARIAKFGKIENKSFLHRALSTRWHGAAQWQLAAAAGATATGGSGAVAVRKSITHLVIERVEPVKDELEERCQVLGARCRHKDVRVPIANGGGDGEAQRRTLAAATTRRQRHRAPQRLLRDGL